MHTHKHIGRSHVKGIISTVIIAKIMNCDRRRETFTQESKHVELQALPLWLYPAGSLSMKKGNLNLIALAHMISEFFHMSFL